MRAYYYASQECERYEMPREGFLPAYGLTVNMLMKVVQENAQGEPPFTIMIPSDAAWRLIPELPLALFRVEVIKDEDPVRPIGEVSIYFSYQDSAHLFYRRQLMALPEKFCVEYCAE